MDKRRQELERRLRADPEDNEARRELNAIRQHTEPRSDGDLTALFTEQEVTDAIPADGYENIWMLAVMPIIPGSLTIGCGGYVFWRDVDGQMVDNDGRPIGAVDYITGELRFNVPPDRGMWEAKYRYSTMPPVHETPDSLPPGGFNPGNGALGGLFYR